jgi:hypothetical protein
MDLAVGMEYPVKAALRADVQATICQHRHDLPRWQRGEFRLVAGQQDPLALFFAEAVSHMAVAALAPVHTITGTSKLPAPALQRGEPDAQKHSQLMGTSPISHALIKDLQSLLAVVGRGQSSPSSPQKA